MDQALFNIVLVFGTIFGLAFGSFLKTPGFEGGQRFFLFASDRFQRLAALS